MKPAARLFPWALVLALIAATGFAFIVPWPFLLTATFLALVMALDHRRGWLIFSIVTILFDGVLLGFAAPGSGMIWQVGPWSFGLEGLIMGLIGGLRIVTIVLVNVVTFQWEPPSLVIEGLGLPRHVTAFLAALLIAMHDIGRDARALRESRVMLGAWPSGLIGRVGAAAQLIPSLLVRSVQRARIRRDALFMAGIRTSTWFVPLIAITAAAMAGRLALIALPNISLAFVVIFAGGVVFGARLGAIAGALSMALSDLYLSGFLPTGFVNVPAMAFVGGLGGWLAKINFRTTVGMITAGGIGIFSTLAFSILADAAEWLLVPEFRSDPNFLVVRIASGLAFNLVPALINGALFALVIGPVQVAFRQPSPAQFQTSPKLETVSRQ